MLCVVILNEALFPTLCEISIILIQVTIRWLSQSGDPRVIGNESSQSNRS